MPRPLTDAERIRLEGIRHRVQELQEELDAAVVDRDLAILDAFNARAQVTDIAASAGLSRQNVYVALRRAENYESREGKTSGTHIAG